MEKSSRGLVAGVLMAAPLLALADGGIDVTAATAGIASAQTAAETVLAAMIGVAVLVWALKRVKRLFGG